MEALVVASGQEHLLSQVPDFESSNVHAQLLKFNIAQSVQRFHRAVAADTALTAAMAPTTEASIDPLSSAVIWSGLAAQRQQELCDIGLQAVADGHVAAVIMSGGQGTRLGFSGPKGMYDMSLPSGKTIFQLHVDKVSKVRQLAHAYARLHAGPSAPTPSVPLYIMTSDLNDTTIRAFFTAHKFFGYPPQDVFFFEQGLEPCFTLDGKVILDSKDSLSMAPDGNGGIYSALESSGALGDMQRRGVQHLHIYGIDNVLTRALDPGFLGAAIEAGAQCANKVVPRAHAGEKVGVTALRGGRMCVVEYCELPSHLAGSSDAATGRLVFGAANICNHYFSLAFLRDQVLPFIQGGGGNACLASTPYHVARKKIPYYDAASDSVVTPAAANGIKLELFIFDVFPLAERWLVLEVDRRDEFAPVKNEPGNVSDSPDTARALIHDQAVRWLEAVGCSVWEPPSAGHGGGMHGDPAACDELRGLVGGLGLDSEGLGRIQGTGLPTPPVPKRHRSITQTMDLPLLAEGYNKEAVAAAAPMVEISPLLSYAGEGLEAFRGAVVRPPCYLE